MFLRAQLSQSPPTGFFDFLHKYFFTIMFLKTAHLRLYISFATITTITTTITTTIAMKTEDPQKVSATLLNTKKKELIQRHLISYRLQETAVQPRPNLTLCGLCAKLSLTPPNCKITPSLPNYSFQQNSFNKFNTGAF